MTSSSRVMDGDGFGRSTLEVMLDAIRQRDEQPKDLPPALPVRPTSRGRLPSSRRSVSVKPNYEDVGPRRLDDKEEERTVRNDKDVVLKSGIFGSKRITRSEKMDESPCLGVPELPSYEERVQVSNVSVLVPSQMLDYGDTNKDNARESPGLEDSRNETIHVILRLQKNFRGVQARSRFKQLKAAAADLQSFVRGERERHNFEVLMKRWRSAIIIQKHVRQWSARKIFNEHLRDVILLQSTIRGCLARQQFIVLNTDSKRGAMPKLIRANIKRGSASEHVEVIKDTNNRQNKICHALAELQSQLLKTEAALREKEEENALLKRRFQEYEMRWSNYESKMKSMAEMWQGQLNSLQRNSAAARKCHGLEEISKRNGRPETSKVNHYCNSEVSSEVQSLKDMLPKLRRNSNSVLVRNQDTAYSSVVQLIEEFDRQQEIFDDDAILVGAKSGKVGANINHFQELQDLKIRFALWKKDYKMRLREAKMELLKLDNTKEKVHWKHWWCTARIK